MKTFAGMVYTDPTPIVVDAARVQRVHMFDVPAVLREDAHDTLPYRAPNVWWTLGEFRYTGEDYTEVFAMWDGREVWYGIERPDTGGVSLVKSGDSRPARPAPSHAATGDVEFRSGMAAGSRGNHVGA